jgi:hypothetical protein
MPGHANCPEEPEGDTGNAMSDTTPEVGEKHTEAIGEAREFYREVMQALDEVRVRFLVGGTYAYRHHTGILRPTKDLDLCILRSDWPAVEQGLLPRGMEPDLAFPHWLGKVKRGDLHVDLIFSGGNGVAAVDERWFEHASRGTVLDHPVSFVPAEELIWSKAFVMERERFDGADIAHLILASGEQMDWDRLLERFGDHWRVLFAHLVLFEFAFPHTACIPAGVWRTLIARLRSETPAEHLEGVCQGTLISREQYLVDLERGYHDARLFPFGVLSRDEIARWTEAIEKRK